VTAAGEPDPAPAVVFARAWVKAVCGTSYVPMTRADLERRLLACTLRLTAALTSEPIDVRAGYEIGTELVDMHLASPEAVGRTVEVIQLRLLRDLGLAGDDARDRLARLIGTLTTGYTRALRDRTLDEQETIRRAALTARDQAELALRISESRFRHQATHDPLTALPNRALFTERLGAMFERPPADRRIGVCFIDLDGFKAINDSLGHHVGDRLLTAIAARLGERISQHLVARLGGDEFVVLVEDSTCVDDVVKVADAALAAIGEPVRINGHELSVSASIGIVERAVAGTEPHDVMRAADITLHWAKSGGKGRWALFDEARDAREVARYTLSAAMPAALDRDEFYLDYQPLVSLRDGTLLGAEALVRWRHPEFGVLHPDRFIGVAEETGLIVRLGTAILAQACAQAARWNAAPRPPTAGDVAVPPPYVSVNLAVRQVRDPRFVPEVCEILERTGLAPDRLQLEITESAVMSSDDEPVAALRTLADIGIRMAIDDFGTGYSNLSYLKRLPVHAIKVDGSFVAGLDSGDLRDERILATLVGLSHTLGLTVTAEGVETAAQADRVRAIGCDAGQGWHFGFPGPPSLICARLAAAQPVPGR
jgi:diguanylate cyclase (GGDEF)-like protein